MTTWLAQTLWMRIQNPSPENTVKKIICLLLASLMVAYSLSGCGCTMIGCDEGLSIAFVTPDGVLIDKISGLKGRLITDSETIDFDCSRFLRNPSSCDFGTLNFFATPRSATLEILDDEGNIATSASFSDIEYKEFQPNKGLACGDGCQQATRTIVLVFRCRPP